MENINTQNQPTQLQLWDSSFEKDLLENRLVSQILKAGDHVTLSFNAKGTEALFRGIKNIMDTNKLNANMNHLNNLIPKKEVMIRLDITPSTLLNWKRDGILVPVKIGRKVYYRSEDVAGIEDR